jgi:putative transposase
MILTYKIKHLQDYTDELRKAIQVANFAVKNTDLLSSKHVKHIGLKSAISNAVLYKYGHIKTIKKVSSANLIIPNQHMSVNKDKREVHIPCLKLRFNYRLREFVKINQIEINGEYCFVSIQVEELPEYIPVKTLGIDRNTTGHCCVAACPETGKVLKLGKQANHIHKKYKNQRHNFQKKGKYKLVKTIKNRESRKIRDINHKMSRKIVDHAFQNSMCIVLENLKGIRKNKKHTRSFNGSLNSWSYYELEQFVVYKSKLLGVPVYKIDPRYTSQQCGRCGLLGERNGKSFKCPHCGHVEDADVNASFVIALRHKGILQLPGDRDSGKGNTDIPKRATKKKALTLEPHVL